MPFMQQGIWILHTVSSSSVHQSRSAWTLWSLFQAAVGQFTVPNDGSGILTVILIALFGFLSCEINKFVALVVSGRNDSQ